MSFGGGASGDHSDKLQGIKKFVTEDELDQKRQKRQEEWEKVRKPDDPADAPEEEYDGRTLFDKLQQQKNTKQEEIDERSRLSNQVRGLDDGEAKFLVDVYSQQEQVKRHREEEDSQILEEYKSAMVVKVAAEGSGGKSVSKSPSVTSSTNKKSQLAMLAGAVKRKSVDKSTDQPAQKKEKIEADSRSAEDPSLVSSTSADSLSSTTAAVSATTAQVIGVLPGLGAYNSFSSDSDNSSSDSEVEIPSDSFCIRRIIVERVQQ